MTDFTSTLKALQSMERCLFEVGYMLGADPSTDVAHHQIQLTESKLYRARTLLRAMRDAVEIGDSIDQPQLQPRTSQQLELQDVSAGKHPRLVLSQDQQRKVELVQRRDQLPSSPASPDQGPCVPSTPPRKVSDLTASGRSDFGAAQILHTDEDGTSFVKVQYDMKFTLDQWVEIQLLNRPSREIGRKKRKAEKFHKWTNREVVYEIDDDYNDTQKLVIKDAMLDWTRYTCLYFRTANARDKSKVRFTSKTNSCGLSNVGMIGGTQEIQMKPSCIKPHVVLHEIGHALGLFHEHMRPDRDDYLDVYKENCLVTHEHNLYKRASNEIDSYDLPYDYTSLMHYGKKAFSLDRSPNSTLYTLVPKQIEYLDVIGNSTFLSFHDIKSINLLYNCSDRCPPINCGPDQYLGKDCKCWCIGLSPEEPAVRCVPPNKTEEKDFCKPPVLEDTMFAWSSDRTVINSADYFPPNASLKVDCASDYFYEDSEDSMDEEYVEMSEPSELICEAGTWIGELPDCAEETQQTNSCLPDANWTEQYHVFDYDAYYYYTYGDVDGSAILRESYPDDTMIELVCKEAEYYTSAYLTCVHGTWKGEVPDCSDRSAHESCFSLPKANVTYKTGGGYIVNCHEGFRADIYAEYFTCKSGELNPRVRCRPEPCILPWNLKSEVFFMNILSLSGGNSVPHNSTVNVVCQLGYGPRNQTFTCLASKWSTSTGLFPECTKLPEECEVPQFPDHVEASVDFIMDVSGGDMVNNGVRLQFSCAAGPYYLVYDILTENNYLECIYGEWQGTVPSCVNVENTCGQVLNGNLLILSLRNFSVHCFEGFTLSPRSDEFVCEDDEWIPAQPICVPDDCQLPESTNFNLTLPNGDHVPAGSIINHGERIIITCPAAHLPRRLEITCFAGSWNSPLPVCIKVSCPAPSITKVSFFPRKPEYLLDDELIVNRCRPDQMFIGDQRLVCLETGEWSSAAECRDNCQMPEFPYDIDIIKGQLDESAVHDTALLVHCPYGYSIQEKYVTCDDGAWSSGFPQCTKITCARPQMTSGRFSPSKMIYDMGEVIQIQRCTGKLELVGDLEIRCKEDGTWSGTAVCRPFCSNGTTGWKKLQNTELEDTNSVTKYKNNASGCKNACLKYKRFLCQSISLGFDISRLRYVCRLHPVKMGEHEHLARSKGLWNVFLRLCE